MKKSLVFHSQATGINTFKGRWNRLSEGQKISEFRELTTSSYWPMLPKNIQEQIKNLVTTPPRPHAGNLMDAGN